MAAIRRVLPLVRKSLKKHEIKLIEQYLDAKWDSFSDENLINLYNELNVCLFKKFTYKPKPPKEI